MTIEELIKESHAIAVNKGWHDDKNHPRTFGDFIALCHSELSEALEEHRSGHAVNEIYYPHARELFQNYAKPEGIPVELADVLIRIFDWCGEYDIPLEQALTEKLGFNRRRPTRHGGKVI